MSQLFSNLRPDHDQLIHHPGSLLGAITLIAGTTVGAGVLALPAATFRAGVIPSSLMLIGVWIYMVVTGLLIAEVNLNTICSLGQPELGLLIMSERTLGRWGSRLAGLLFVLIHYALLVAYIARGGTLLMAIVQPIGFNQGWIGLTVFAGSLASLMIWGRDQLTATVNGIFVLIVLAAFLGLIGLGLPHLQFNQLLLQNWDAVTLAIPIMVVALVYQSVVPIITSQLEGNRLKIQQAILVGSAIPLAMFLLWNAVILGISNGARFESLAFIDPLDLLRQGNSGAVIGVIVSVFSEFAVATSFIGFVYGLLDFYTDIFQIKLQEQRQRLLLHLWIVTPALVLAILNPTIFFTALDYAGTFGVSVLFGIIPALMAWQQRYHSDLSLSTSPLVPGGKITLMIVIAIASVIILQQIWLKIGL